MPHWLYLLSVSLHILSAVVWVGGMLFLGLVLVPVTRKVGRTGTAALLLRTAALRFRYVAWVALGILLITGAGNLWHRLIFPTRWRTAAFWSSEFGTLLAIKLGLVVGVLVLSALHDFVLGPRLSAALALAESENGPSPSQVARLTRLLSWLARLNVLLALAVLMLAVLLLRGI